MLVEAASHKLDYGSRLAASHNYDNLKERETHFVRRKGKENATVDVEDISGSHFQARAL